MTVRISIRWYGEDGQEHAYPTEALAGDWAFAEPVCAQWTYGTPHPRRAVSSKDRGALGNGRCLGCGVWARQNDHEVVVDGQPVAGVLCGELAAV